MDVPLALDVVSLRVTDGMRDRYVLRAVSLAVRQGELLAVMGPSGSGKTSLVNVACGLVAPTSGSVIMFGGRPPQSGQARRWWAERRRRDLGVVYQRLNLVPGLSALENVALPLELDGLPAGAARTEARRALEQVGLDGWTGSTNPRLSVGEQQLVAIARGIVGDRRILLVDEPTAALDRAGADRIVRLLSRLAREGRAVVMVTHASDQAAWADRIVMLRDGQVEDEVAPAEVGPGAAATETVAGLDGLPPPPVTASPSPEATP